MLKGKNNYFRMLVAVALVFSLVFTSMGESTEAAPTITKQRDVTLTTAALTDSSYTGYMNGESFQQDGIVSHNGWQYTAFWTNDRHVNVSRRQLPSGNWQNVKLTDYTNSTNDSHNTISIGISPLDGTLHLSFDHHNSTLHYRKTTSNVLSNPGSVSWSASLFGSVQSQLTGSTINDVTYPRFVTAPNGRLQFFFRTGLSGDGDTQMYEYNGSNGNWSSVGMFIRSSNASPDLNPYYFGFDYDSNGRLHVSWTWRDTFNGSSNHNIMYVYSDDNGRNWKNNSGSTVGSTGNNYITPTTSGITVWNIPQNRGLINQESQSVDSQGRLHIAASHMPDSQGNDSNFTNARNKSYVFHYVRNTNGSWSRSQVPHMPGVSRSDIGIDNNNDVYMVMPSSINGTTRIASASASTGWTDWQIVHSETNGRFASEPLIDHARLKSGQNILTFVQPETGNGRIAVLDFQIAGPPSSGGTGIVSGSTYNIVNVASGKALDVWNNGTSNGTNVAIYTLYNNNAQKWTATENSDGSYRLINPNSNKALDAAGTSNGSNVLIWGYWGGSNQKWDITENSDGSYQVINQGSNKALDAAGTANGDNVLIWDYWGGSNQKWDFVPAN